MADNPALHFRALLDLRLNSDSGLLKCDGFLAVAVDRMAQRRTVIGIDRDPLARAADRNVKLLAIDELNDRSVSIFTTTRSTVAPGSNARLMHSRSRCAGGVGVKRLLLVLLSVRRTALASSIATTVADSPLATLQRAIRRAKLNAIADGKDLCSGQKTSTPDERFGLYWTARTIIGADGDSVVFSCR